MPSSCFNCKGQSNISNEEFVKNEQKYYGITNNDGNQSDQLMLFGYSFHKGHSLVYDIPLLFKIAKYVLMELFFFIIHLDYLIIIFIFRKHLLSLSSVIREQYKTFRSHDQSNCKTINYADIRHQISQFLLFLRDSIKR